MEVFVVGVSGAALLDPAEAAAAGGTDAGLQSKLELVRAIDQALRGDKHPLGGKSI